MGQDILFAEGDLLQYSRPMGGRPDLPDEMTVRAVVSGFSVGRRDDGDVVVNVWLHEGAHQIGEPREVGGSTVTEGLVDKERELVSFGLGALLSFDPEVVRRGNSPRELTNFEIE